MQFIFAQVNITSIKSLRYLNQHIIPFKSLYKETLAGGFSGIDYDAQKNQYYIISDDRSNLQPARFYTANIQLTDTGVANFTFSAVHFLTNEKGKKFLKNETDPENLRFLPTNNTIWWTSEGERILNGNDTILNNPSIFIADTLGVFKEALVLPAELNMQKDEKGPRRNGVLEACTFSPNLKHFFFCLEEPLYEDGERANLTNKSSLVRWYQYTTDTKKPVAAFAYNLDPVAYPPNPSVGYMVNGIPDILALNDKQFLVIERSFSTGRIPCTIKIFLADITGAENVLNNISFIQQPPSSLIKKTLLLNLDSLPFHIDNIEGLTIGPKLSNGNYSLLMIADNNFSENQVSQLLTFEIVP